jgi:hypothetical protein
LEGEIAGKSPRGTPRMECNEQIMKEVKIYTEIKRVAENRRVDWGGAAYQFSD